MGSMDDYTLAADRYDDMTYRRVGTSGLKLPALSLGLWQNFGHDTTLDAQAAILRAAFDHGITHFDLANNYGPGPGAAEENFGRHFARDFQSHRDEMIISTKAGFEMNPSPYGTGGSRKYLVSSLDASLRRLGLDYVDIFYHHCPDPETPLEESLGALRDIVAAGKALYVGISNYDADLTAEAADFMEEEGCPLLIHQPRYNMLDRWVEEPGDEGDSLLEVAADAGLGVICYSPLAQGRLTDRYLDGIPADSRIARAPGNGALEADWLSDAALTSLHALHDIAGERDQTLAQMALAWILRDRGEQTVTSVVNGASSVAQLESNLHALDNLDFSDAELEAIDSALVTNDEK